MADTVGQRRGTSAASLAARNGHVRPAAAVRRMRLWGTPGQIWLLTALFVASATVLVLSIRAEVDGSRQTVDVIGAHSETNLTYAQNLYFVLAGMDTDAANYMLVGSDPSPPETEARISGDYQALRQTAVNLLISVDQNVAHSNRERYAVYRLEIKLHQFDSAVAVAWQLNDQGRHADALVVWEQATDLMQNEIDGILEAALDLADINRETLNTAYTRSQAQQVASHLPILVAASGSAGAASALVLMLFLFRRTRRAVNPPLVVAALLLLALMAGASQALTVAGERLEAARQAYDTVDALRQTRALVFDSKADESRYLLDPGRRRMYEGVFLIRSRAVASFPSRPTLGTYDAELARQVETLIAGGKVDIDGDLGTALAGVRGDEEAATARAVVASYTTFQRDDRVLRADVSRNDMREAIRFTLSPRQGESQGDLIALDADLGSWIAIEQNRGDANLAAAAQALDGWQWIPVAVGALVVALVYLGIRPRLREYPSMVTIIASRVTTSR